jgi:hypothetical protein
VLLAVGGLRSTHTLGNISGTVCAQEGY